LVFVGARGAADLPGSFQCWLASTARTHTRRFWHYCRSTAVSQFVWPGVPGPTAARVFWKRLNDAQWDRSKSLALNLNLDGRFHSYHLDLASSPEYRDLIIGMAIEPVDHPRPGEEIAIKSVVLSSRRK